MKPVVSTVKPVDYDAIAIRVIGRSPLACALIAVQVTGRKTGLKKTNATTLMHKSKTRLNSEILQARAEAILHLYSEYGLGTVRKEYGVPVIHWNPRLNMFRLGEACRQLWKQWRAAKKVDEIGKGKTVVCMMPSGSLEALKSTGLAKTLEIELLTGQERAA